MFSEIIREFVEAVLVCDVWEQRVASYSKNKNGRKKLQTDI